MLRTTVVAFEYEAKRHMGPTKNQRSGGGVVCAVVTCNDDDGGARDRVRRLDRRL